MNLREFNRDWRSTDPGQRWLIVADRYLRRMEVKSGQLDANGARAFAAALSEAAAWLDESRTQ
jgi:hypothetical protein